MILVSIFIDLTGSARGRAMGLGGRGHLSQGPGTIIPCADAVTRENRNIKAEIRNEKLKRCMVFPRRIGIFPPCWFLERYTSA
jgi:hypothetical protein